MSTKKDKFTFHDKHLMKLAFNLASSRKGLTGDNPAVGCVITKKNQIISVGRTSLSVDHMQNTMQLKIAMKI